MVLERAVYANCTVSVGAVVCVNDASAVHLILIYHTIHNYANHRFLFFRPGFYNAYGQCSECVIFDELFILDTECMILIEDYQHLG